MTNSIATEEPFISPVDAIRRQRKTNRNKIYCNSCLILFTYLFWALVFFDLGILTCADEITFNNTIIIFNKDLSVANLIIIGGISSTLFTCALVSRVALYCNQTA